MGTEGQVASFDQATLEAMINNLKGITDAWATDMQQQAKQRQGLQDQLNAQSLRWADDAHTLAMRTADLGASLANRIGQNAATLDNLTGVNAATLNNLILSGEVDTTAQGLTAANMADKFGSAAKQAIDAAVAATTQTSAAAQGTTGVAQGALQMQLPAEMAQIILNNNTVQTALLAELAKIEQALAVILVKVTGEAVEKA